MEKFFRLKELSSRRVSQLDREKEIDTVLEKGFDICPKLVFRYLATSRAINREKSKELYSACFTEYLERAFHTLDTVEKHHAQITTSCPVELCKKLPDIIHNL